jgi:hypothetical protein
MKRLALLGAVAALAAVALPGVATAGELSGVVVAKDAARRSVAVASRGDVHTLRTARFGALKLGQRVTAAGVTLGDGTFSVRTVRVGGRVKQVQFRAVVVRHEAVKQRLIVSAGGTVFAFRLASGTSFASDGGLAPGDKVTVSADVKKQELEAQRGDVKETGHVEALKLEGIFLHQGQDSFDIAVVHRGLVHIRFTPGADLPDWKAGDIVFVLVSLGSDGAFAFLGGRTDGKPGTDTKSHGDNKTGGDTTTGDHKTSEPPKTETQVVAGVVAERSVTQIALLREDGTTVSCAVPSGLDLSVFAPGERVQMYCRKGDNGLVLMGIKSDHASVTAEGRGEASFAGTVAEISGSSSGGVSLKTEDGRLVGCAAPAGLDLTAFRAGDKVKLVCVLRSGKFVVSSLRSERAFINVETGEVGLTGILAERTDTSIGVNADGASLRCRSTTLDPTMFPLGGKVSLSCKRADAGLVVALVYSSQGFLKADGTGERTVYGTLLERGELSVTVTLEGGATVSCAAPATIDLAAFHAGNKVKMRCRLKEGQWRLSLLASETATVEVPL